MRQFATLILSVVMALVLLLDRYAPAAERMALIIGNSNYAGSAALRNPGNDADAMEAVLKELGFSVTKKKDLDLRALDESVVAFRRTLRKGGLALFFYSGHGVQLKGTNYLVPIGAQLQEESKVRYECYDMGQVLDLLGEAEVNLKIVVLDCCRDNPLQRSWGRSSARKGLAGLSDLPQGTIIAFSTSPNQTASDGEGRHSPYTEQLVSVLRSRPAEGLEVSGVFRKASQAVKQQTGQVPWLNLEASLDYYYLWRAAATAKQPTPGSPAEMPKKETPPATLSPGSQARTITNSVGMKLTLVPAGEFTMGSPDDEKDASSHEHPQHKVRITRPYYLGVYEVTQAEYERVMGKNPSYFSAGEVGKEKVAGQDTSRFPVEQVSWDDAVEFCRKLSELPEEKSAGRVYRLPTEAQWEYACRAGTTTPFSFGSVLNGKEANADGSNPYGTDEKGPYLQRTTTVGSYSPNAFGLYDMHGNVYEWCADWHESGYYGNSPVDDPSGPSSGSSRVNRGGGWEDNAVICRSADRGGNSPGSRDYGLGFRVSYSSAE